MKDYLAHDDDVILQLLEEPRNEGDLDEWLSGTICGYYHRNQGFLHMDGTIIYDMEAHW
jgi:hypothetical protein